MSAAPPTEAELRVQLAACYRVFHLLGWTELIYNHITVRIPGPERHFLINPFFYMIDGFRRGFFGASDVSPWLSLAVVAASFAVVAGIALQLLRTGYKIRS